MLNMDKEEFKRQDEKNPNELLSHHPLVKLFAGHYSLIALTAGFLSSYDLIVAFDRLSKSWENKEGTDINPLKKLLNSSIEKLCQTNGTYVALFKFLCILPHPAPGDIIKDIWEQIFI